MEQARCSFVNDLTKNATVNAKKKSTIQKIKLKILSNIFCCVVVVVVVEEEDLKQNETSFFPTPGSICKRRNGNEQRPDGSVSAPNT